MKNDIDVKQIIVDSKIKEILSEALSKKTNIDKSKINDYLDALIEKKLNEKGKTFYEYSNTDYKNNTTEDFNSKDKVTIKDT